MIIANSLTTVVTPLSIPMIKQTIPGFPDWVGYALAGLGVLNVIFAVGLLKWKKWAFFGFVFTALIAFGLNVYAGLGIAQSILGLFGIAVLYGVLQIGGEKKGWTQLD